MTTLVIRVLSGPRAGAEATIGASGRATIGHEYWHDIVLRDPSTRGHTVELELGPGEAARLTVLEGSATLLGTTVRAGDAAALPPFVPLTLGRFAFAFGQAGSPRWDEATALAVENVPPPPAEAGLGALATGIGGRVGRALQPAVVFGVAAAIVAAFTLGPAIAALNLGGSEVERTVAALDAAGYHRLRVTADGAGAVRVVGYVATDEERERLRALLGSRGTPATLGVDTGEEQARAAADVARLNGFEVQARAVQPGIVELTTRPLDPDARGRLERLIRHDVPGLSRVVLRDDAALRPADDVRTLADVTRRVASVVGGDPAYILTADGARYFPGAIMPSGHRLVAIRGQQIVLEHNGHQLLVKF